MKKQWKYRRNDSMSDIVERDYRTLLVMSRFGIGLGFGDMTILQACEAHGVDPDTFIAVLSTIFDGDDRPPCDISHVSPEGLIDYLSSVHVYYLDCRLPAIRRGLIEVWDGPESDLSRALINYYDDLVNSITKHVHREESELFPYVRLLSAGKSTSAYPLFERFPAKHSPISDRIAELRRLLIKYYPARDTNRMNDILFEIHIWEYDMNSHISVEERLLYPIVESLEHKIATQTP
ncbi:MAG: hemerythrin domain-containing protein [Alistipes sp.]|jgi:regulator of cell morphogenesis and NO signaling|nr:hemerythrin domain-containing protein [Alistipes sp.]